MRYWIISFLFLCFCLGTYAQKNPVSVIITAGQSNTDGRVSNNDLPDYIKKNGYRHCLWSYGSDTISGCGRFERFWPRVAKPDNKERWGYDAIVYYLIDQHAKRDFYVIKESLGGTAIDTACVRLFCKNEHTSSNISAEKNVFSSFLSLVPRFGTAWC